jgi:hypothetical protein
MELAVKTSFATDDQTRSDLDLIEGENSLYRLFAPFAQTDGGRIRLQEIMDLPINDYDLLVKWTGLRKSTIVPEQIKS